jgi:Guanylate kinase
MGRIICLMGRSATGKDTIFKRLAQDPQLGLCRIVPYTTRPIREGEKDGVDYFFTHEDVFQALRSSGRIIEERAYHTIHGLWRYFTVNDGQLQDEEKDYITIGTLEAYRKLQDHFGSDRLIPVMIELEDGVRLQRALDRERAQEVPKYEEMCRRFLADCQDFSQEKVREAGIARTFCNDDLEKCLIEIKEYLTEKGHFHK